MRNLIPALLFFIFRATDPALAQDYFQQDVAYTIHVKLDDKNHELSADIKIAYTNNSPHELPFIWMHIWPNAYKNNKTALARQLFENGDLGFYFSSEKDKGYIDKLDFKVNGEAVKWEFDPQRIDICKILLNQPLKSGEEITITTPFQVKIPLGKFSRLGHIDQQYQITQWYPKPAVYDKNGWNHMPYLTQGEFYSEFGTFDVYITLPKNYVVGATGDLVDGDLEMEWLNEKARATEELIKRGTKDLSRANTFPASDTILKTLHYRQERVHDFAWFADKRYHVLKGEVETPHDKNKVTTWTMFTSAYMTTWANSITYMNDAIYYYSLWNGDYPYKHATAVDGALSAGGGMEYPNVTVIGAVNSNFTLEKVIMHEVGHNWFYGILGSNERMHPWMDEGINSFNENRYVRTKYPDAKLIGELANSGLGKMFDMDRYKHKSQYELLYLLNAARNQDQPIELPSYDYTNMNYGAIVYSKTALVFDYMFAYLGERKFDHIMQKYFETWKFKHPQPEDLRKIFEEYEHRNFFWLFEDLVNTTSKLDYKFSSVKKLPDGSFEMMVKNKGKIRGPVPISGIKDGKQIGLVWFEGFAGKEKLTFPSSDVDYFKIDLAQDLPEINRNNNSIRTRGLFRKIEPIKLQFIGSLDNPDKTQLFWSPVMGWNKYNKTMLGLALYNSFVPRKKLEYELMPLYAFGNKDLAGGGRVFLNFFPDGIFQTISVGGGAARYAYAKDPFFMNFNKFAPELKLEFRQHEARCPYKNLVDYRYVTIVREHYNAKTEFSPPIYTKDTLVTATHDLNYTFRYTRKVNPYSIRLNVQSDGEMVKAGTTVNYEITIKPKKAIDLRLFAGKIITGTPDNASRFKMSGRSGNEDYLYDHIFLGRTETEGLLSRQFTETDGAFKTPTTIGQTSDWLLALNVKSFVPKVPMLKVFADAGYFNDPFYGGEKFQFDAGVMVSFMKNIFEVYVPLLSSKDISDQQNGMNFAEKIRFTLNLNALDPFTLMRNLSL